MRQIMRMRAGEKRGWATLFFSDNPKKNRGAKHKTRMRAAELFGQNLLACGIVNRHDYMTDLR